MVGRGARIGPTVTIGVVAVAWGELNMTAADMGAASLLSTIKILLTVTAILTIIFDKKWNIFISLS